MDAVTRKKSVITGKGVNSPQDFSDQHYLQLIQGLPAAIYTCDALGHVQSYNYAATQLWGREPAIGHDLWCGSWKIYKTDGSPLPLDECPMAVALKEKRAVCDEEIIVERPDGSRRNVLPHPMLIFNEAGELVEAVNMLVDITERKQSEQALKESEELFRTMADQAPNIVWMTDEQGREMYLNAKWCAFTGQIAEKGYSSGWLAFIHSADKERTYLMWKDAFEKRLPFDCKFRYRNAANEYHVMNAHGSPRLAREGKFNGYIGIMSDITLQENTRNLLEGLVEERTRDLIKANTELARSNFELEQFAYAASHDLQEPLRKILVFASQLKSGKRDLKEENAQLYIEKITSSALRMSRLIDEILNFSRLSRNNDPFVGVDLNRVLENVRMDFELLIKQKNAIIQSARLPMIEAVQLQMHQLFGNLINNALKFSKPGRQPVISISCNELQPDELDKYPALDKNVLHYSIVVRDNGIGFDPEYSQQIFVIFQRLNSSSVSGSGIGLALCKKIVNNHHGEIFADSIEGEGSAFYLILPARQFRKG